MTGDLVGKAQRMYNSGQLTMPGYRPIPEIGGDGAVSGRRKLLSDLVTQRHGLVGHVDGEPVGWRSLAPCSDYTYLRQPTWNDPAKTEADGRISAVTCFLTRVRFRHQGVSGALVGGTIELARDRGPRAIEAYPMKRRGAKMSPGGEMHVGALSVFLLLDTESCTCHRCGERMCASCSSGVVPRSGSRPTPTSREKLAALRLTRADLSALLGTTPRYQARRVGLRELGQGFDWEKRS